MPSNQGTTTQNVPGASTYDPNAQQVNGDSQNGYFNLHVNAAVDFTGTAAEIEVSDQAGVNVDENLVFTATSSAAKWQAALLFKQTAANTDGGNVDADKIDLAIDTAAYADLVNDLFTQVKESAVGDLGVASCSSLGDYVVGLVAWAVFGNYKAVAPIVNDSDLTAAVDGSSATVAQAILDALITSGTGASLTSAATTFNKTDLNDLPLGNVLASMIKYHPDRFQSEHDDLSGIPFMKDDYIEFTVTFENLKVVESVAPNDAYLKAEKNLPYDSKIDTDGYLIGGADAPSKKWTVGIKFRLLD